MMDYSLENLHVLLEQEIGAYATVDYLRMTPGSSSIDQEHRDDASSSHVVDDEDDPPDHTSSTLQTLGATAFGSRKRKRVPLVPDDVDLAFAKARTDREVWRQRVCTWCYAGRTSFSSRPSGRFLHPSHSNYLSIPTVVDHAGMSREVVSVAMNLLDRYSAVMAETTSGASSPWIFDEALYALLKHDFQLTSMGCLFIASKLYGSHHPMFREKTSTLACLVQMTKRSFSEHQLAVKEKDILKTLYWKVHPPTPQAFVSLLALELKRSLLPQLVSAELEDLAEYLIELSVSDYFFVSFKPSEVALASLVYSLELRLFPPATVLKILPQLLPFPLTPRVMVCSRRLKSIYQDTPTESGDGRFGGSSGADTVTPDIAPSSIASPVTVIMDLRNQTNAT